MARTADMVDLERAFDTNSDETKRALRRLNTLRRLIVYTTWTPEYLEFVTLFCQLAEDCRRAPETKTNVELRFAHGDQACNCLWFPVIRHGLDLAYAFVWHVYELEKQPLVSREQRKQVHVECRKVIGILRYLETVAYPSWEDFVDHPAPYTLYHHAQLLVMCRAYLVYAPVKSLTPPFKGKELFERAKGLFVAQRLLTHVTDQVGIWNAGRLLHEINRKDKVQSWIQRTPYEAYVAFGDYAHLMQAEGVALGAYTLAMNIPGGAEPENYPIAKTVNKRVKHEKVATANEVEETADQWLNIRLDTVGVTGLTPLKVEAVFKFV